MANEKIILLPEEPRGASQLIECPIPAVVVSKQQLPDVQNLRSQVGQSIIIKALRLITADVLAVSPLLGIANAALTELQKMSLVLYSEGWEKGQLIPLLSLVDIFTEGSGVPWRSNTVRFDNWQNVDWSKSYFQYSSGTPSNGTAYAVLLECEYVKLDSQGKPIVGAS